MSINVTRSSMPPFEEYCEEIKELWESHWLTNMGAKHVQLQAELEKYLNVPHVALYTNGHLALENAFEAFDFQPGSEVITTPFTFASTTHSIARSGLVPVFCDINPEDYTIDVSKIEALITDKTVAIMPVHVYGNLCDSDAIAEIAKKHGLKVIYDAAHAFGVTKNGKSVASLGDVSMFSFHATKVFNTIEGGALCFADDDMVTVYSRRRNFGLSGEGVVYIGGNAKMNEFQAAMGICNLRHLEEEIEKRRIAAEQYRKRLSNVSGIKLCAELPDVKSNYAYFPVVFDGYKYDRDQVFALLAENNVIARKYFFPLTNTFKCYTSLPTAGAEKTPVAAHIAECVLTLPLYADLSTEEVDTICDIILN
ncbi:MAG: DegT/DnrJ/EryC1/StrS family aminotransferase [Ruminococcaceae bacterium]|nr:DegT/DnrJ/EryC1/StrS family aminotransferase [Oscillospiraceae bacterium]